MTIIASSIKFRQSQRMTDFPDGGGRMSSVEIVDNAMNNVFPDLSTLNAVVGNVGLRKLFLQVDTATTDTYLGPFVFLTDPPADPLVHVTLFSTGSVTDLRADARDYVEAYRTKGPRTQFTLYSSHLAGQATIQVFCREEIPTPDIGDVFCLSVEAAGYPAAEQYVRVREVLSRMTVTFEDGSGEFKRDVLLIAITSSLAGDFVGQEEVRRNSADNNPPTKVRRTQVASAARYFTVKPLVASANAGDVTVTISTPYIPLVPASQAETPLTDQLAGLGNVAMIQSGLTDSLQFSGNVTGAAAVEVVRHFGTPYKRRSLQVSVGAVALRDDGSGNVVAVNPADLGWSGTADYQVGSFSIAKDSGFAAMVSATATPAGAVLEQGFTLATDITATSRQQTYVFQLPTLPAPGTILFEYRALGRWIRLTDTGAGTLTGAAGEGSATATYATGTIAATLGALPDVDSSLQVSWGTDVRAHNSSGDVIVPTPRYRQALAHQGIVPGSLSIAWLSGGVAKSATVAASGAISGDMSGLADHAAAIAEFSTIYAPDTTFTYSYTYADPTDFISETFTPTAAGGAVSITLTQAPVAANSVAASWNVAYDVSPSVLLGLQEQRNYGVGDNGAGGWTNALPGTNTINYTTGAVVLTVEATDNRWIPNWAFRRNTTTGATCAYIESWEIANVGAQFEPGTPLVISYMRAGATTHAHSEDHGLPPLRIYLGAGAPGPAVPGSLRFTFRGRTYHDRGGTLVYDVSSVTNAGTVGGSYDYSTNYATITAVGAGNSNTVSVASMLTRFVDPGVSGVVFRAPAAPLREGSFTVRATTRTGDLLVGNADVNGNITGDRMKGKVRWETGQAQVMFGELVTAAGNEGQDWYDPAFVVGGQIWRPLQVDPSSIFFGTVVFRSIPADPSIIGIDPVRLPVDGRVVGYQPGDVLVLHHTQTTAVASPVAGAIHDLGRLNVSLIEVHDAAGVPILSTWYTLNLNAGTLTWANPLNLSAYTMPVRIRDRIEHAVQCSDVQVTGQIGLQAALPRAFPAGSLLSSAIPVGDMQARYTNLFDQQTYQPGVWSDVVSGTPAAASYNDVNYPIEVDNRGAIDERWAIVFTSPGVVNVIGETVGQVITGASIAADIQPVNPVSGTPFLTIRAAGFGGGWAAQNVLRVNTVSATRPFWAARTRLQGEITQDADSVRIQAYGNAH